MDAVPALHTGKQAWRGALVREGRGLRCQPHCSPVPVETTSSCLVLCVTSPQDGRRARRLSPHRSPFHRTSRHLRGALRNGLPRLHPGPARPSAPGQLAYGSGWAAAVQPPTPWEPEVWSGGMSLQLLFLTVLPRGQHMGCGAQGPGMCAPWPLQLVMVTSVTIPSSEPDPMVRKTELELNQISNVKPTN